MRFEELDFRPTQESGLEAFVNSTKTRARLQVLTTSRPGRYRVRVLVGNRVEIDQELATCQLNELLAYRFTSGKLVCTTTSPFSKLPFVSEKGGARAVVQIGKHRICVIMNRILDTFGWEDGRYEVIVYNAQGLKYTDYDIFCPVCQGMDSSCQHHRCVCTDRWGQQTLKLLGGYDAEQISRILKPLC